MDEAKTAEAMAQAYMRGRERVRIERAGGELTVNNSADMARELRKES